MRLGRWVALAALLAIAVTVGFSAGRQTRAQHEFRLGLANGISRGSHDRALLSYQTEMSLAGLDADSYSDGSGYYITLYYMRSLMDTLYTGKVELISLPYFAPCLRMVPGRYYQVHRDGTIGYRDR